MLRLGLGLSRTSAAASANLWTFPEALDSAAYTVGNTTVSANATNSPTGTATADKLAEDNTNNAHYWQRDYTKPSSTGSSYVFSCYAKQAERTLVRVLLTDTVSGEGVYCDFNLAAGTSGGANQNVGSATSINAGITADANGFYRIFVTANTLSGNSIRVTCRLLQSAGVQVYAGTTGSGIYFWGMQLEPGTTPTAYS